MNLYQILGLGLLLVSISATFTNTTDFWKDTLKVQEMHYQCYSGINIITQDTKRSTGTTPRANPPCTTACSVPTSMDLPSKIPKYPSSSGCKEDQDPAHNSAHSPKTDPSESPRIKLARLVAHGTSLDIPSSSISRLVLDSHTALTQPKRQ
jgi:hypothetical protein